MTQIQAEKLARKVRGHSLLAAYSGMGHDIDRLCDYILSGEAQRDGAETMRELAAKVADRNAAEDLGFVIRRLPLPTLPPSPPPPVAKKKAAAK